MSCSARPNCRGGSNAACGSQQKAMGVQTKGTHPRTFLLPAFFLPVLLSCTIPSVPDSSSTTQPSAVIIPSGSNLTSFPEPLVISVLYFEDRIHLREFAWARKGLADMLITDLTQASGLRVVQRERLEVVLREQSLQAAGRIEEKTAVRIGRLTGATVILLGSATRVGETLRLDASLAPAARFA